ncbi:hypothetical protein A2331_03125 [Candidatus Falkowbacteria bacterium RIFOXYB2_FULL_34_18]|uniref:YibE/F family protein n=1 Tax=Candidatus Falkowbacteria bacterium RIFOXYD2_FULL_34_120 TaxID=1798007 RepID=A0A1F5TP38_9BACT|nr:MAG: hypothetical protein A2500_00095 [Candidatus Falkowbacteria bacterium RIFOXYC12_FULL_34_55]OGF28624.1 MAG: hypothetical protein A2331_03125 [Candidatus Falkowbacteria bacterium RIFOXYB2_FULL_34_18]OGF38186.1 MAG: hypothetical protein A2466_00020 [Candidatus Falkowbacteria bacterium RIFOXYC2_FULL_34_220]OGF38296.1 MAG: hypothetical protein A2515_00765 [Candidatus Falkowbacteria bacterium RIFOXYD12_FULL_34_57]OGF40281.1 MAG: hypothetical protein A2531_04590 [Candidatus Falkowbacteria bact
MKKKLFTILILLIFPILAFAQEPQKTDIVFKAKILEVLKEVHKIMPDGTPTTQQNIKLKGLEGEFKDKEIIYRGVDDFDVIKKAIYKEGDTVLAIASFMNDGEVNYYIIDFVRNNNLWTLTIIFILTLLLVGGFKGGRSLLSLFITFFIIIKFIIPQIVAGQNPIFVSVVGGLLIMIFIIYITEGLNTGSHIAVLSIFLGLLATIFFSNLFIKLAHLSGVFSEEIFYLVDIGDAHINFQGLLLAGIIIGTLGVLDDVVISQIAAVEQIYLTNKHQTKKEIFKKAYKIGISHISSMTNTLFLAYAGVSLPLLILFLSGQSAFSSFEQIVNNEQIATEIVRTLAGSIGLILSVPISTTIAVWWFKKIKSH